MRQSLAARVRHEEYLAFVPPRGEIEEPRCYTGLCAALCVRRPFGGHAGSEVLWGIERRQIGFGNVAPVCQEGLLYERLFLRSRVLKYDAKKGVDAVSPHISANPIPGSAAEAEIEDQTARGLVDERVPQVAG